MPFKKVLEKWIEKSGYHLRRQTPQDEIRSLLRGLHPRESGHSLIRMGGNHDGGYLIPDDLSGISACFSPGIDETSAFELDCAKHGMRLFLADASVSQVGPELSDTHHSFIKKFIGVSSDEIHLTLDEWVDSTPEAEGELLLQMDIEGSEYEALLNCTPKLLNRFRIVCLELHHIGEWRNPRYFQFVKKALDRLTTTHDCVHSHPNNSASIIRLGDMILPNVMELTFLRKDRMKSTELVTAFPHPLDADCVPNLPHVPLPTCWYGRVDD